MTLCIKQSYELYILFLSVVAYGSSAVRHVTPSCDREQNLTKARFFMKFIFIQKLTVSECNIDENR
jgi:hypothetical protein